MKIIDVIDSDFWGCSFVNGSVGTIYQYRPDHGKFNRRDITINSVTNWKPCIPPKARLDKTAATAFVGSILGYTIIDPNKVLEIDLKEHEPQPTSSPAKERNETAPHMEHFGGVSDIPKGAVFTYRYVCVNDLGEVYSTRGTEPTLYSDSGSADRVRRRVGGRVVRVRCILDE